MDVPPRSDKTASCPLNVPPPRSRRFSPFSHDLDSSPQQRTRPPPLPHPNFRGRGSPAPLLFRARFLLPLSCRRASFPSVTGAQPRQLPFVHSSPDCVLRVFFCLPRVLSSLRQKRPSHGNASFSRGLVFPSLPCVRIPRPPSPAPHLLCIPGEALATPTCFRPAPLHTQKARLHDADGPLHCKKTPIRNQACIPG